jgi:phospho-N-acetylmuramoyl-pentapeptide-transferase
MDPIQNVFAFIPGGDTLSISIIYFVGASILAFAISPFIINLLYRLNILRKSKGDKVGAMDVLKGKVGTPIMGGLIIIIATLLVTVLFNWKREYTYIPIGALLLSACVGGIDDLLNIFGAIRPHPKPIRLHIKLAMVHRSIWKRVYYFLTIPWAIFKRALLFIGSKPNAGLQVHEKLILQAFIGVTVGLWIYLKNNRTFLWIPFLDHLGIITKAIDALPLVQVVPDLSGVTIGWLIVPFVALTIMTVTNAVNISDGMDGLAGGLLLIAFAAYAVIAFGFSEFGKITGNDTVYGIRSLAYFSATVAGATLAYLYFNAKPARVQMSDVGSLAMGTLLSVIAILLRREFTLLLIAGVFLMDGIGSRIIQRIWFMITKKKLFKIIPLHYHFELKGWPEEKVVVRFWVVSLILTAVGVWLAGH